MCSICDENCLTRSCRNLIMKNIPKECRDAYRNESIILAGFCARRCLHIKMMSCRPWKVMT